MYFPFNIRCDTFGNIYYSDYYSYRIRKISIATNIMKTIIGNGVQGYSGENIAAKNAQITFETYLNIYAYGHVYIVDFSSRFFLFFFNVYITVDVI
jgi:hypothetical protein